MKILKALMFSATIAFSGISYAAPVQYSLSFLGSTEAPGTGPLGTGGFLYDSTTQSITGFNWNFGAGASGSILDSYWQTSSSSFLRANILFNTSSDPNTTGFSAPPSYIGGVTGFAENDALFCWGLGSTSCDMTNPLDSTPSYKFVDELVNPNTGQPENVIYTGYLNIAPAITVPEPTSIVLLGIALVGLGVSRRNNI
jgi:hypothetical protein